MIRTCIRRLRFRAMLAMGLVALLASAGNAQPFQPKTTPIPLVVVLVPYLGDENVQKDLKLEADQTKKLIAYRQKLWDTEWNTAPKDIDPVAQNKSTEAEFKAVLSAEQFKRANQLAAQIMWTGPRFGGFGPGILQPVAQQPAPDVRRMPTNSLMQYPAIGEALKLDDTQKKFLEGRARGLGFNAVVFLTPEQSDRAKELLGPAYTSTLQPQFDNRDTGVAGSFGGGRRFYDMPSALEYTLAKDVQKELKLTADQNKSLGELRMKWENFNNTIDYLETSPAERKKSEDKLLAETEKGFDSILDATQRKRLKQIDKQAEVNMELIFPNSSELRKELAITEDQVKKSDSAVNAYVEALEKVLLSGESVEKVKAAVEAARKDHDNALTAILTKEQVAKREELFGTKFTGQLYDGGFNPLNQTQQKLSFGRYTNQLSALTRFQGVREELKLSEDQIKKLTEAITEAQTKFPTQEMFQALQDEEKGNKFFGDRSAFIEKTLADVLTKEQRSRFREIQLQRLEAPLQTPGGQFGPFPLIGAASYPGVAEAIKLTEEQKKKLLDGEKAADVLTGDQKKLIAGMLGKAADLAKVYSGPFGFGRGPGIALPTLSPAHQAMLNLLVWDGLKLTRDQIAKLAPAANEYNLVAGGRRGGGGFGPGGGGGFQPPKQDVKELTAAVEAFGKAVDSILSAEQRKRLDQLALQLRLASALDGALLMDSNSDFGKAMALTAPQRSAISATSQEFSQLATLATVNFMLREKELPVRRKLRDALDTRLLKELTEAQRAKLKELTGEPFDGFGKQPLFGGPRGFGGGFGGFGGGFGPFDF